MNRCNTLQSILAILFISAASWITYAPLALADAAVAQPSTQPAAPLSFVLEGKPLAGKPVVMDVTVTNTGTEPISYWCGGPGAYPGAQNFVITVTGADGKSRELIPTNGQYEQGSGIGRFIKPGEAVQAPMAIGPLAAGVWSLQIATPEEAFVDRASGKKVVVWPEMPRSAPVSITVTEDVKAGADWDKKLLDEVRADDRFAWHVATEYKVLFVIDAMLRDLDADDHKVAMRAAVALWGVAPLPRGADKAIDTAIAARLRDPPDKIDSQLLVQLVELAEEAPTDAMLDSVLAVAHTHIDRAFNDEIRVAGVSQLRHFPQPRAGVALKSFLTDDDSAVVEAARRGLKLRQLNPPNAQATSPSTDN